VAIRSSKIQEEEWGQEELRRKNQSGGKKKKGVSELRGKSQIIQSYVRMETDDQFKKKYK